MDDITTTEYNTRTVITGHLFVWNGVVGIPEARSVAVYLHYDSECMPSPKVVEKGDDSSADFMVTAASKMGIPVVQHSDLARALYEQLTVNDYVPLSLGVVVANVISIGELAKKRDKKVSLIN